MVAFWWLGIILTLMGAVLTWWLLRRHRSTTTAAIALSHTLRYTQLPAYVSALKRYMVWRRFGWAVFIVLWLALTLLVSRPASQQLIEPALHNRDIMLCLDVSGSMRDVDAELLKVFAELTKQFKGERIGLTIFDNTPAMVFPLTDDYAFVQTQLEAAIKGFDSNSDYADSAIINNGVYSNESGGSSLIGDGLAGCVMRFDALTTERSRSIILATDNMVSGTPIVTLQQAATIAREKNIRIYGINPYDQSGSYYTSSTGEEYKAAVLSTHGAYYTLPEASNFSVDTSKIGDIVTQVTAQDATRYKGGPRLVTIDRPAVVAVIAAVSLAVYLFVAWRLRL